MAQPFLGEIRPVGFNFAPRGWALCEGQLMPISQNSALFQLVGTIYGGDGQSTFGIPDLRSRVPVGQGAGYVMGQTGGVENVTLSVNQLPAHNHAASGTNNAGIHAAPGGNVWATDASGATAEYEVSSSIDGAMHPSAITSTGGSQPHPNLQPYLPVNFIIALQGIFPSQG